MNPQARIEAATSTMLKYKKKMTTEGSSERGSLKIIPIIKR